MKRQLAWVLVLAGCGGAPVQPELIVRDLPVTQVKPRKVEPKKDLIDAGGGVVDAGCCVLPFALRAESGEISARLVFPEQSYAMDRDDAGVWRVQACVDPTPEHFFFKVGYPTDDDAGVLEVDRVNSALTSITTSSLAAEVNVFDGADGGVCSTIGTGQYSQLPDAG